MARLLEGAHAGGGGWPVPDDTARTAVLADEARLRSLRRACLGPEPDEAFERFAAMVRRLLDVPVALVSLVDADRQYFPGASGLAEPWNTKRETPLSHSFCQHVTAEGRGRAYRDARMDAQVRDNLAIPEIGVIAYAGMPLTDADGRALGSLCAIDTRPRDWTAAELATLADLAAACSSELRVRIAHDLAEQALAEAEAARRQLAVRAGLIEGMAAVEEPADALRCVAEAVVPHVADWCVATLTAGAADGAHVAVAHRDPGRAADVRRFADLSVRPPGAGGPAADEAGALARALGDADRLTVPVAAPVTGAVIGTITLVNGPRRPAFTDADARLAADFGRAAGLAVVSSRVHRWNHHVAEVLQRHLLTELPEIPGVGLHARYLPAQSGAAVGGDWYDAFLQPDGSVMLAVGDVCGHDIEAAATMGQLRNVVRGDAYGRDDEPGQVLTNVHRAMEGMSMAVPATMLLARLRRTRAGYTVTFANAGHPPPVLLRPDGVAEVWWEETEPLLGLLPAGRRSTRRRTAPPGSTLVLYTDGLVEDARRPIDEGLRRLARLVQANAGLPAEQLCDVLVEAAPRRTDDIAVLMACLAG